ncbi:MAG: SAM-dependent DNA methyltransferase [Bacteroidetes bacterium]|nr:SAM-dependent DNA methyltransferase [Bacteroidota bacterium]
MVPDLHDTSPIEIARKIRNAATEALNFQGKPEARLRELVAPLWDTYIRSKRINLNFYPRDERQLANGRPDTVFNQLILEYKKPGTIHPKNEKNRKLISQVQGYIEDLAKEERWKDERLLGVAFDGNYFLFIYKVKKWIEEEPIAVSEKSVERFLEMLEKLTSKAALVPENLIRDFAVGSGSRNFIASNAIRAFYFALTSNTHPRVKVFFEQWALQFAEVHGALENKKFDAQTLFKSYGFRKEEQRDFNFLAFFFALDTYYGLLMKLLAYQVVGFYTLKDIAGLPLSEWDKLSSDQLLDKLQVLEEGGIFRAEPLNIRNFLEGDLLSWYPDVWNDGIEKSIRDIIDRLNQYDPETMEILPDQTRDILKKLYQFLVPKQIRHDLGEYYTPDWLAERCLNQVGYGTKDPDLFKKRVLDPGCGSGTFLILAIKRLKEHARLKKIDPSETLLQITKNIVGFDLNPLAVISARTNYLLAVADLLKHKKGELTIPVYLCDSINPPSAKHQDELFDQQAGHYQISTSVGTFRFPEALVQRATVQQVTLLLEDCAKKKLATTQFLDRVHRELKTTEDRKNIDLVLGETYEKLLELERKGINGIWARIIKNAFAPLFSGIFDFIVGNPPWVNWEALPNEYRNNIKFLWLYYGLFTLTGGEGRLGGGKKDISMLMLYVSIDKYLRDSGKLCFIITQTIFKTQGAGDGFRRFRIGESSKFFKINGVEDLVDIQPFEGATNQTAIILLQKGQKTEYPVNYTLWIHKPRTSVLSDDALEDIFPKTIRINHKARPISGTTNQWINARPLALNSLYKILGVCEFKSKCGIVTGANGAFWIKVLQKEGNYLVQNVPEIVKFKKVYDIPEVHYWVEPDLVFYLLRGCDVRRWHSSPSINIIIPQDPINRIPINLDLMQRKYPNTLEYLRNFESILRKRPSHVFKQSEGYPFYAMFGISEDTFLPNKVVFRKIGEDMISCAVHPENEAMSIVADQSLNIIPTDSITESYYLSGVLNSLPIRWYIKSTATRNVPSQIISDIRIQRYNTKDILNNEMSRVSKLCHEKVAAGISVTDLEEQIDELAAELWGLTKEEMRDIKESLEEMR